MLRIRQPAALAAVLVAMSCLGSVTRGQDAEGAAPANNGAASGATPEFKTEKYLKTFNKGREEFEAGKYKDAAKSFKSASRGGKSKADKDLVKKWAEACKAGPTLQQAQAMKKRGLWNEAYDRLLVAMRKYAGTPIEPKLLATYSELERLLFQPVEAFDRRSPLYSKKFGKTFISDPKLQNNGTMCLHWQNTRDGKPGALTVKTVPPDWSKFSALEFWVNTRVPGKGEVILECRPAPKKGQSGRLTTPDGKKVKPVLMQPLNLPRRGGWQYVRLRLADFKEQAGADLSRVNMLRLQFQGGQSFDFFLDDIRLRRRNPSDPKKKASGTGRRR